MGVGHLGTAVLAMLGQTLIIADVLQPAQGLTLGAEFFEESEWMPMAYKRDDGEATGEDWITVDSHPGFRLHPNCAGYMDNGGDGGSGSGSDSGSDSGPISATTMSWFTQTISNVVHLNKAAGGVIPTLRHILDDTPDRSDMTPDEKSQIDLFMALYGKFKLDDDDAVNRAKNRVEFLSNFADEYVQGLESNSFKSDIICDADIWETTTYGEDKKPGFKIPNEPLSPIIRQTTSQQVDPCTSKRSSKEKSVMGFSVPASDKSKNYFTICPMAWDKFTNEQASGDSLADWSAKGFDGMFWKSFESIVRMSPEGLFTHELSHSDSYWKDNRLLDRKLSGGVSAYGWDNLVALGEQDKNENDLSKVGALNNAETYEFWSGGAYLRQCNWSTGVCMDPEDPDSSESEDDSGPGSPL